MPHNPSALQSIIALCGLRIEDKDVQGLQNFIAARRSQLGLGCDADYLALLRAHDDRCRAEFERLSAAFSSTETYFMRDSGQIELLRRDILPELIARSPGCLRIWSCGCSSGEEAYSLAILLDQLIPDKRGWILTVVGSDIDADALQRARRARYGEWSFRGCDPLLRQSYFQPTADGLWELDARIRDMVRFERCDLIHDPLPAPAKDLQAFDLIVCRNVFIYFSALAVQEAVRKLTQCLQLDGVLMTGHGELLNQSQPGLRLELHAESALYRRRESTPRELPSPAPPTPAGAAVSPAPQLPASPAAAAPETIAQSRQPTSLQQAWQLADAGALEPARSACRAQLAQNPLDARAHFLSALLDIEAGALDAARQALRRAIYLDHSHIAAYIQLAEVELQCHRLPEALRLLQAAVLQLRKQPAEAAVEGLGNSAAQVLAFLEARLRELSPS